MDILILLFLLSVKHWIADFVMQTYQQTIKKGIYGDLCGMRHSLDHVIATFIVLFLFSFLHHIDTSAMLIIPIIEGVIHYHIDWVKVRFGSKDITKPIFWNQFGQDQLAHQITYLVITWYLLVS